jgi:hypothetical protein
VTWFRCCMFPMPGWREPENSAALQTALSCVAFCYFQRDLCAKLLYARRLSCSPLHVYITMPSLSSTRAASEIIPRLAP